MKKSQSGFTLMEMLTTVVIAGIVIGFGVPAYGRFVASSRLMDQTSEVISLISVGRSEAIRRNATIRLCRVAQPTDTSCPTTPVTTARWQHWIMTAPTGITASANGILRRGSLDATILIRSVNISDDRLIFTPDGLVSDTAGLVNNNDQFTVCTSRFTDQNFRRLRLGASSRVTTFRESTTCS